MALYFGPYFIFGGWSLGGKGSLVQMSMPTRYLKELSGLVEKIGVVKDEHTRLECRHFFSGAAGYVDSKMFASLSPVGFALKLPEKYRDELIKERGSRPLRYFPKGHVKKDYVVLPERILENNHQLKKLVDESIKYVLSSQL